MRVKRNKFWFKEPPASKERIKDIVLTIDYILFKLQNEDRKKILENLKNYYCFNCGSDEGKMCEVCKVGVN